MCVNKRTTNAAVLGNCGRHPMYILTVKRVVKYWCKILKLSDDRLVKKCYYILIALSERGKNNWVSNVKLWLFSNRMRYVLENQCVPNERSFIKLFMTRLSDQYLQDWNSSITNSDKLITYIMFRSVLAMKPVLNVRNFAAL